MGIELFRGIAALMVLLTHYARFVAPPDSGLAFLWTGVDMFFVISGFVFAPMVFAAPGERVAVKPYLVRRFFRIYPLYVLAVLAYFLFAPADPQKPLILLKHLFFLHTTSSIEEAYYFNPAFWSLPVEIEFYLALPLLALLGGSTRRLGLLFGASLLLAFSVFYLRGPGVDVYRILSAHLTGILPEFCVGMFLWRMVQRPWRPSVPLTVALLGAALVAFQYQVKFGGHGWETIAWLNAPFNFLCALGYAMLMFPVLRMREPDYRPALARLALFCGAISYGVYLFHNLTPAILVRFGLEQQGWDFLLLSTAVTVLAALALYHLWENPMRNYGRRISRRMLEGASESSVSPAPEAPRASKAPA